MIHHSNRQKQEARALYAQRKGAKFERSLFARYLVKLHLEYSRLGVVDW